MNEYFNSYYLTHYLVFKLLDIYYLKQLKDPVVYQW